VTDGDQSFSDLLAADPRFSNHLSRDQIDAMLDPTRYTGLCSQMAEEQAARARALAADIDASLKAQT
ncbi:MAG: hypothetical protein O2985_13635, partial [Proteobacteria bacterium]|nr:hypothetical protein [Pseudomonadota bacterium]